MEQAVVVPETGEASREVINPQINESNLMKEQISSPVKTEFLQPKETVNPQVDSSSLKRSALSDLKPSKKKKKSILNKFS